MVSGVRLWKVWDPLMTTRLRATIDAGPHTYYLAWGHGGQQIAVLPELDMVIVVTADPLFGDHGGGSWSLEKANLNLVANFIADLPAT